MKTTVMTGIALAAGLLSTSAFAAGDIKAGEDKAYTCVGCHGEPNMTNVYPSYKAPLVGGLSSAYVVNALKAYADGSRWHPTMQVQAKSMSEQDMADIAAYLESLGK
jgi:cytochrome c553